MSVIEKKRKKRVEHSLSIKINALRELDKGIAIDDIARHLEVSSKTVKNWMKNRDSILGVVEKIEDGIPKKLKRIVKLQNPEVDEILWDWFQEKRKIGVPISGKLLTIQALAIHESLHGSPDGFVASNGWLQKFKKRHNLRNLKIVGEKKSSDSKSAAEFVPSFQDYITKESLSGHQIFNCDETGLNFKSMPNTTLASRQETNAAGYKQRRERITVMACTNVTGSLKLPLMVISKYVQPRCIKDIMKSENFPVYYKNQKSAWMIGPLFSQWFHEEFVPKVTNFLQSNNLPLKAVLLVDMCSAHPKELLDETDIKMQFLPPNTTALIQPMDQGILQALKLKYRHKLMRHILDTLNTGEELEKVVKNVNLRNAIHWVSEAWNEMPSSTIQKSWKPLLPNRVLDEEEANLVVNPTGQDELIVAFLSQLRALQVFQFLQQADLNNWLSPPTSATSDEILTDEEFLTMIREQREQDKENSIETMDENSCDMRNNNNSSLESFNIADIEAVKASMKTVVSYFETSNDEDLVKHAALLRSAEEKLNEKVSFSESTL